jgi:streptogramin lyase
MIPAPNAISDFVRRIFQDTRGDLWFGTNGDGVCRLDGQSLTYYSIPEGFGGTAVRGIVEDEAGNVWFATSGGVTKYDGESFANFTVDDGLNHDDVWCTLIDRVGMIWAVPMAGRVVSTESASSRLRFPFPRGTPTRGVSSPTIVRFLRSGFSVRTLVTARFTGAGKQARANDD